MKRDPPSRRHKMLPWEGRHDTHRPFQLDFGSLWYTDQDWARMRAQHLAQGAMKVQMQRLADAGKDHGGVLPRRRR